MRILLAKGLRTFWFATLTLSVAGCLDVAARNRLALENQTLREAKDELLRKTAEHEGTITALRAQVATLQGFSPDRPVTVFAPVKLEIASLSGGADYDEKPGDDGVTIHLRLLDADGDSTKAPGKITVQLLDTSRMGAPRVAGLCVFDDAEKLREAWYGRFGTRHYTLRCPFSAAADLAAVQRLDVKVEYLDYQTGATLTTVGQVDIHVKKE